MTARKIDVRQIVGFREMLNRTILTEQIDRDALPDADKLARIRAAGIYFVQTAVENMGGDAVVYAKVEWPENGPLERGLLFAFNPRHPNDPEDGTAGLQREYTGQGHRVEGVLTWEQAESDLQAYAVASFGRPTLAG